MKFLILIVTLQAQLAYAVKLKPTGLSNHIQASAVEIVNINEAVKLKISFHNACDNDHILINESDDRKNLNIYGSVILEPHPMPGCLSRNYIEYFWTPSLPYDENQTGREPRSGNVSLAIVSGANNTKFTVSAKITVAWITDKNGYPKRETTYSDILITEP